MSQPLILSQMKCTVFFLFAMYSNVDLSFRSFSMYVSREPGLIKSHSVPSKFGCLSSDVDSSVDPSLGSLHIAFAFLFDELMYKKARPCIVPSPRASLYYLSSLKLKSLQYNCKIISICNNNCSLIMMGARGTI